MEWPGAGAGSDSDEEADVGGRYGGDSDEEAAIAGCSDGDEEGAGTGGRGTRQLRRGNGQKAAGEGLGLADDA